MTVHDVVVVGAGAAGIGAGLELAEHGLSFVILEAADRVGGRALTDRTSLPVPWDHGCHWLHSADVNPLVPWADRLGAVYAREEREDHFAIWQGGRFASAEELIEAGGCTLAAFAAIEAAAERGRDVSIAEVLPEAGRWT
ncbi:MAG: NAD(P)-binding protein, partial [Paracoccaceae bacterium]